MGCSASHAPLSSYTTLSGSNRGTYGTTTCQLKAKDITWSETLLIGVFTIFSESSQKLWLYRKVWKFDSINHACSFFCRLRMITGLQRFAFWFFGNSTLLDSNNTIAPHLLIVCWPIGQQPKWRIYLIRSVVVPYAQNKKKKKHKIRVSPKSQPKDCKAKPVVVELDESACLSVHVGIERKTVHTLTSGNKTWSTRMNIVKSSLSTMQSSTAPSNSQKPSLKIKWSGWTMREHKTRVKPYHRSVLSRIHFRAAQVCLIKYGDQSCKWWSKHCIKPLRCSV
jgi:hypothetical protein